MKLEALRLIRTTRVARVLGRAETVLPSLLRATHKLVPVLGTSGAKPCDSKAELRKHSQNKVTLLLSAKVRTRMETVP